MRSSGKMTLNQWARKTLINFGNAPKTPWREVLCSIAAGFIGEGKIRKWMAKKGKKHIQVDLMVRNPKYQTEKNPHGWAVCEIKRQKVFKAGWDGAANCPFDGHGLPPTQVKDRIEFSDQTGLEPVLFVVDPEEAGFFYFQKLRELDRLPEEEKHYTKTGKNVVYPLTAFHRITF